MVKGLHDDEFQLIPQKLLDGCLMFFFDFRIVRQHARGAELLTAAALIRCKKFLHGLGRIRAVVQNLRQRRMPRLYASQRIAQCARFLREPITLPAQSANLRLQLRLVLLQGAELARNGLQFTSCPLRVIACTHRGFQHLMLIGFQFPQRFALMRQSFFRLFLLAVQPQQALACF